MVSAFLFSSILVSYLSLQLQCAVNPRSQSVRRSFTPLSYTRYMSSEEMIPFFVRENHPYADNLFFAWR